MTGTIKQDAEGMANGIAYLAKNVQAGKELMAKDLPALRSILSLLFIHLCKEHKG